MASLRKRRNSIDLIVYNGVVRNYPDEIKKAAVDYFQDIFTDECSNIPTFQNLPFKTLSHDQASKLTAPFSTKEIDEAVTSCASDKAPGPNGFNFRFIKHEWEIIKNDVYAIIQVFWKSAKLPRGNNTTFIALIPKSEFREEFKDFRPISMVVGIKSSQSCWLEGCNQS